MINKYCILILLLVVLLSNETAAQSIMPPKPLFDDPIYHGAADPVVIYHPKEKSWWMFYTNRRATMMDSTVAWVHGTKLGIAVSEDGVHWLYKDTANINYRPNTDYTFWAPEIIAENGTFHMYLSYIPGIYTHWNHPAEIVHLTSTDLMTWDYQSTLKLSSNKVIDANVLKLPSGGWRLWYNDGADGKSMYYADSKDLYHWEDKGKVTTIGRGEGPKIFEWQGMYFMIVDCWKGMDVYASADLSVWKMQAERILELPGTGKDEQAMGGHADVIVKDNHAYIYYFTHPDRRKDQPAPKNSYGNKRSVIQMAELKLNNGVITCDRDAPISSYFKY